MTTEGDSRAGRGSPAPDGAWWADVQHLRERLAPEREVADVSRDPDPVRSAASPRAGLGAWEDRDGRARIEREAAFAAPAPAPAAASARQTVRISGRGIAPPTPRRLVEVEGSRRREREARGRRQRPPGQRPDRIAGWAVLLGIVLALLAAASAKAAPSSAASATARLAVAAVGPQAATDTVAAPAKPRSQSATGR